ncbi:site-specific integrase [Hyphococcus flavus]|uniref:Site-specific integrase n=1 Tax=Hyphococcus flavus TaxID=1866326 RepID=A0AAF0CB88_9PROT|nr:site-specific integrase [Hyphococcus flavus]WDI30265.1 site-specific integrase [Hyphococcus flavus]
MPKRNPENERIKRRYIQHLQRARGYSEATILTAAASIDRFIAMNGHKSLKKFHIQQAVAFRERFEEETNPKTGKLLSKSTISTTLKALRDFFTWLAEQPGYKSRIKFSDAAYFTPSLHDERIARSTRRQFIPTLAQIHKVIHGMPTSTIVERRNRALIALTILVSPRDGAAASLRLKHIDMEKRVVFQDGAEVNTKFRKTIKAGFYPIGGDAEQFVAEWVAELRDDLGFGPDDPLFPKTKRSLDRDGRFEYVALDRAPWRNTASIRKVFRKAFESVGLPYASPHSFRHTLGRLAFEKNLTIAQLKAWSQNLGHEEIMTTATNYAKMSEDEQLQVLASIGEGDRRGDDQDVIKELKKLAARY